MKWRAAAAGHRVGQKKQTADPVRLHKIGRLLCIDRSVRTVYICRRWVIVLLRTSLAPIAMLPSTTSQVPVFGVSEHTKLADRLNAMASFVHHMETLFRFAVRHTGDRIDPPSLSTEGCGSLSCRLADLKF